MPSLYRRYERANRALNSGRRWAQRIYAWCFIAVGTVGLLFVGGMLIAGLLGAPVSNGIDNPPLHGWALAEALLPLLGGFAVPALAGVLWLNHLDADRN